MRYLVAIFCVVAAGAQQRAEFSLRLVGPQKYHQGELISAEIKFPSDAPGALPQERWQMAGLLLDPPAGCGWMASPCVVQFPRAVRAVVSVGPPPAIDKSATRLISLNRYLPALQPGHYQTAVLARKLSEYAVSNSIEFEVTAASPEWISQTIAASVAKLKTADTVAAAEQLRPSSIPTAPLTTGRSHMTPPATTATDASRSCSTAIQITSISQPVTRRSERTSIDLGSSRHKSTATDRRLTSMT